MTTETFDDCWWWLWFMCSLAALAISGTHTHRWIRERLDRTRERARLMDEWMDGAGADFSHWAWKLFGSACLWPDGCTVDDNSAMSGGSWQKKFSSQPMRLEVLEDDCGRCCCCCYYCIRMDAQRLSKIDALMRMMMTIVMLVVKLCVFVCVCDCRRSEPIR